MKYNLYIVWNEENNLAIPIIDEQHRSIISTINTLHYFIVNKKEENILDSILIILEQYTKLHFVTEEEIMRQIKYPKAAEHIKLHRNLGEKTTEITGASKNFKDSQALLSFLKNWWLNHICIEDRKYAQFLSENQ